MWEDKYETNTREQSWEITELKFNLRAERIGQVELQAKNQSIRNALRAMEQSLREHKNYILEHQEYSARKIVEFDRTLVEAWRDRKD